MRTPITRAMILLALVSLVQCARGQLDLDSLNTIWRDPAKSDSVRFRSLNALVRQQRYTTSPDSLLSLTRELLKLGRRVSPLKYASSLLVHGSIQGELNQWDSAETSCLRAYDQFESIGDTLRMAGALNNLGNVVGYKGDQIAAIGYLTRSLRLGESSKDSSVIARALGNIGVAHLEMKEYGTALDHFERRIAVAQAIGDKQCELEAWINIGVTKDEMGLSNEARSSYLRGLQMARSLQDVSSVAAALGSLGILEVDAGNHEQGRAYLDSALALGELHGDLMIIAGSHTVLAKSYTAQGDLSNALQHAEKAMEYARQNGTLESRRDAAEAAYGVFKAMGRTADALTAYERFIQARDSVSAEKNLREVMRQRFQYDYDKKEALLAAEQEKKDAVAAEALRRKNLQRNAFIGGFGLMVLLAGTFFFQRNRISKEKARSEELLLNILPEEVAEELKEKGEAQAVHLDQVTVLFTDFKGFTSLSENLTPRELVRDLNECFSAFDKITTKYGIEKIKTIGDAYMAAGGIPVANSTHAVDTIKAALEMRDFIEEGKQRKIAAGKPYFEIRIGVHSGPVVAGIVGVKKFQYDIWGDTVNTASRMESSGEVGKVNISEATYRLVNGEERMVNGRNAHNGGASHSPFANSRSPVFTFTPRGKVQAKGKGEMEMYFVDRLPG